MNYPDEAKPPLIELSGAESCLVSDWKRPVVLRAAENTTRRTSESPVTCLLSHWLSTRLSTPAHFVFLFLLYI